MKAAHGCSWFHQDQVVLFHHARSPPLESLRGHLAVPEPFLVALEIIFINQQSFHLSNLTFPKRFTNDSVQCGVTSIDCRTSIQCTDKIFKFNQNNIK